MKCSEIRALLSLYIDHMLEPSMCEEVAAHLAVCPDCKQEYEELIQMLEMLSSIPEAEMPKDFDEKLHKTLIAAEFTASEQQEELYQTVPVKKRKLVKRVSAVCAIFVVGIFAAAMYNNSNQLMPFSENLLASENQAYDVARGDTVEGGISEESFPVDDAAEQSKTIQNKDAYYSAVNGNNAADTEKNSASEAQTAQPYTAGEIDADQNVSENAADSADAALGPEAETESPATRGSDNIQKPSFIACEEGTTCGAVLNCRDSIAIQYYVKALEREFADMDFEILLCESYEEGLWKFEVEVVSTDEDGNEMRKIETYYGQDGTIWTEEL